MVDLLCRQRDRERLRLQNSSIVASFWLRPSGAREGGISPPSRRCRPVVVSRGTPDQLDGKSPPICTPTGAIHGVAHNRERARRLRAAPRRDARRLLGRGVVAGAAGGDLAGGVDAAFRGGAGGRPAPR